MLYDLKCKPKGVEVFEIYEITCTRTGQTYRGQHKYLSGQDTKDYYGSGVLLQQDIKKYGKKYFKKSILKANIPTQAEADRLERYYIQEGRNKGKCGYNLANGGQGDRSNVHNKRPVIDITLSILFPSVDEGGDYHKLTSGKNIETVLKSRELTRHTAGGSEWSYYTGQSEYASNPIAYDYRKYNVLVYSYQSNKAFPNAMKASIADNVPIEHVLQSCDNYGKPVNNKKWIYLNDELGQYGYNWNNGGLIIK